MEKLEFTLKISTLFLVYSILTLSLVSCDDKKKSKDEKKIQYLNVKNEIIIFDTVEKVKIEDRNYPHSWNGYNKVNDDLKLFQKNSPNEILITSDILLKDVQLMRDSLHIDILNQKGMRSRINALYNHALRLQDMKDIPSIEISEIVKQIKKIFSISRMIDRKINAIYKQIDFENNFKNEGILPSKKDSI